MSNEVITVTPTIVKIVTFSKPFNFEGKEYKDIDLSAVEDMTADQLCQCEKRFEAAGNFSVLKEMNLNYALIVASVVTALPIEFFMSLPAKEAMKIKNVISGSFFS